ncbi:tetratricopeptide repeat protein [Streptomyces sp. BE308]|uniref:tetratricopeptide repeat protein n=1 Tax=Streptomyces sp. BE308 TaxID=3002529 RepID=UPI002E777E11|nr:tetratricopeptide repeat protein [Streptomyces sp. BE308]MEE1789648.1 tetratricopeptide repeat protein [Streptomyces sp. BE308]
MPKGTRNTRLAALQQEARWTNGELAREVNRLGTLHGLHLTYDRTAVAHWLSGSRPRPPVPALVAEVLSRRLGRLVTSEWTGLAPRQRATPSSNRHPILALAEFAVIDVESGGQGGTARLFSGQEIEAELSTVAGLRLRNSDSHRSFTAQRLEYLSSFFYEHVQRYGGLTIGSAVSRYLADETPRLLVARSTETDRPEVLTALARLSYVQAAIAADSGRPGVAQGYYQHALRLARRAGSRSDYAITLRALATLADSVGESALSLKLTGDAIEIAGPNAAPAVRSFLHSGRALALAWAGDRPAALRALSTALRVHPEDHQATSPFGTYTNASLQYQRALVLKALGAGPDHLQALLDSLRTRPDDHHRALAITHSQIALALLHAGQWDQALPHAQKAFASARAVSSMPTHTNVAELRQSMAAFRRRVRTGGADPAGPSARG